MTARVYVGTYAKYNNGSIKGAWVDLEACASHGDFIAECHAGLRISTRSPSCPPRFPVVPRWSLAAMRTNEQHGVALRTSLNSGKTRQPGKFPNVAGGPR